MKELNRKKVLEDYVKFCNDTNMDTKSKKSKETYKKVLVQYMYYFGQITISEFDNVKHEIDNLLKYNTLTIEKLKGEI
jgi:hypothetical protein